LDRNPPRRLALLQRFREDRRGVSVIAFAGSAVVLLGAAGLALDGGFWIHQRRDAQTAADTAAQSGALALLRPGADANAVAADVAARNNWPTDDITVGTNRVTVIVQAPQQRSFSALFLGTDPLVRARAVAGWLVVGPICMQANGSMTFQGNFSVVAEGCVMYANGEGPGAAYTVNGSPTIQAAAVFSGDAACPARADIPSITAECYAQAPPAPLPDSMEALMTAGPMPSFTGATCLSTQGVQGTVTGAVNPTSGPTGTSRAWCGNGPNSTLNFQNATLAGGVYYVQNASLTFSGTTTCVGGCTFVLMGNNPGNLEMNGSATVTLTAPTTMPIAAVGDARDYQGVLFYRHCIDPSATCARTTGQPNTSTINGSSTSIIQGAMYFPYHDVLVAGTGTVQQGDCNPIVGRDMRFTGTAEIEVSGCGAFGIDPAEARVARLLE